MPVVTYCAFDGLNTYFKDEDGDEGGRLQRLQQFIKAVFGAVQKHADEAGWLPVYWNIGDEPVGDDVPRSAVQRRGVSQGVSQGSALLHGGQFVPRRQARRSALPAVAALCTSPTGTMHDEASVKLLHEAGGDWAFYNGGNRWTYGVYLYKAAKQYDMKFRLSWHWNAAAGDPYYALDCREDDYAWCCTNSDGELISTPHFERLREGLDDYRRLLTLARLAKERPIRPPDAKARNCSTKSSADFVSATAN